MSRRDVTTPTIVLLNDGIFYWPSLKIDSLVFAYNNFSDVFSSSFKGKITNQTKEIIRAQIKLEIVITSVHCAEILASYLIAFEKKGKAIQRVLFNYKVKNVNEFYSSIQNKNISYIAKIFSYPQPYQVIGQTYKSKIKKSCIKIKKELSDIAKYYSQNLIMYNSYKHGMRISVFLSGEPNSRKRHGIIGYLTPDNSYYPASVTMIRLDHTKAVKITSKMTALLINSTQNYRNRLNKNTKELITIY